MRYDAPLIITGAPRSGTTGLQIALSAMDGVCIWYETEMYSQICHPYESITDRGRRLVERVKHHRRLSHEELLTGPMALRNPLADYIPYDRVMKRFHERFGPGCDQRQMREFFFDMATDVKGPLRLYGDKMPREYAKQLPELVKAFPDCRIIFCLRDGRDVVASRVRRGDGKDVRWAAHRWVWINSMYRDVLDNHPEVAERVLRVHLEDTAKNVVGHLGRIADFVGLDLSDEDRDTFRKFYRPTNIGRWKTDEPDIEKIVDEEFMQNLRYWGYT